jgi:hypothetical protein
VINGTDIWPERQLTSVLPLPSGVVVSAFRHPRQLPMLQYHGFTPRQRALFRSVDISIKVVDTAPGTHAR